MNGVRRVPTSTYRLQLNADFDLRQATRIVDYLHELGIDWIYTSPLLTSLPGSPHGYDIVDATRIDRELGSEAALLDLSERLRGYGMGLLLDVVANHMGAYASNPWWRDLLEAGALSPYARFFDVDFVRSSSDDRARICLPVLGDQLSGVLARSELSLARQAGRLWLAYFERRFPLCPESVQRIVSHCAATLDAAELSKVPATVSGDSLECRSAAQETLANALAARPPLARAFDELLNELSLSQELLAELLSAQHYELCYWKDPRAPSYRRFFDVSELVGLRVEEPDVFAARHEEILRLVSGGQVTGLRIDHVDGLCEPAAYLRTLRRELERAGRSDAYLVVEKILAPDEQLPAGFAVDGTTGYEAMRWVDAVLVDADGAAAIASYFQRWTGERPPPEAVTASKAQILASSFLPERTALANLAADALGADPTRLDRALTELLCQLGVYRTYVEPGATTVEGEDRRRIEQARQRARRAGSEEPEMLDRLSAALLLEPAAAGDHINLDACRRLLLRFQQLSGAIAAKGVEDTTHYRYLPVPSLCEVGQESGETGIDVGTFLRELSRRSQHWPAALTATSTHDTKRSEDVRARLHVLSERPELWCQRVGELRELCAPARTQLANGRVAPSPKDEYLLYATLVGTWQEPDRAYRERIAAYMEKAMREAKRETSWTEVNAAYETGVQRFVTWLLEADAGRAARERLSDLVFTIADAGRKNGLAMLALKLAAPGVPDFYQGSELWTRELVDPDNRGAVDYGRRRALLAELRRQSFDELVSNLEDDRLKLWVTQRGLGLRARRPTLFAEGAFVPLAARGPAAERVIAFARVNGAEAALCVVGRHFTKGGWPDTVLPLPDGVPAGSYRDVLSERTWSLSTSAEREVADLLQPLGVTLLERVR